MSFIAEHINNLNNKNRKALSVFLTAGFPDPNSFVDLSIDILNAGADILELGIPFSDPIADGPVIQKSSKIALDMGVQLKTVLEYTEKIKQKSEKPIILMGYANPILNYGIDNFITDSINSGVDGLIIPDIPLDEYDSFWNSGNPGIDRILLTTPTSSVNRIQKIDDISEGFVYCVSVTGITGSGKKFNENIFENIKNTYSLVTKNKMLIGFGISGPEDIKRFQPMCDGVIVGSAIINLLIENKSPLDFVRDISKACIIE